MNPSIFYMTRVRRFFDLPLAFFVKMVYSIKERSRTFVKDPEILNPKEKLI